MSNGEIETRSENGGDTCQGICFSRSLPLTDSEALAADLPQGTMLP